MRLDNIISKLTIVNKLEENLEIDDMFMTPGLLNLLKKTGGKSGRWIKIRLEE